MEPSDVEDHLHSTITVAVDESTGTGALSLFESASAFDTKASMMSHVGIYGAGAKHKTATHPSDENQLQQQPASPHNELSPSAQKYAADSAGSGEDEGSADSGENEDSADSGENKGSDGSGGNTKEGANSAESNEENGARGGKESSHLTCPTSVKLFDGTADVTSLPDQTHVGLYKKTNVIIDSHPSEAAIVQNLATSGGMGDGKTPVPAPTPSRVDEYIRNGKILSDDPDAEDTKCVPLVTTVYTKNSAYQAVHVGQEAFKKASLKENQAHVSQATANEEAHAPAKQGTEQFEFQKGRGQCVKFRAVSPQFYSNYKLKTRPKQDKSTKAEKAKAHVADCQCVPCRKMRRNRVKQYTVSYHSGVKLVSAVLEAGGCVFTPKDDWQIMWNSTHLKSYNFQTLSRWQKVNQFPRTIECTRKDTLSRNIQRMQMAHGKRHFDFLPASFIVPRERDALYTEMTKNPNLVWICKPASSACGRGISITKKFSEMPVEGLEDNYIIERYIHRPLLFNGFKFDLRLYVAITSFNPLRIYLHDEGLVRLATVQYEENFDDLANHFVHLTNYSINKFSEGYQDPLDQEDADNCDSTASKLGLKSLKRKLINDGVNVDILWRNIEDLVIKTILSIEMQVTTAVEMFVPHSSSCFELFGFDVLIDCDLRPWLLEVNFAPSLACDTQFDLGVKSTVLSDMFNMVGLRPRDNDEHPITKSNKGGKAAKKKTSSGGRKKNQGPGGGNIGDDKGSSSSRSMQTNNGFHAKVSLLEQKLGRKLTTEELRVVRTMADEVNEAGGFKRIFPGPNSSTMYRSFFESERPLNTLAMHIVLAEMIFQNSDMVVEGGAAESIADRNVTSSWRHNRPSRQRIDPNAQLKKEERRQRKMAQQDCRANRHNEVINSARSDR
jgi:tubulin polyglutamylase TTLL5